MTAAGANTVPTVDLGSVDVAAELDKALRGHGFVQLVGHGLDRGAADELWASMDELFGLPLEVKRRHVVDDPLANRGYRGRGSESLSYSLGEAAPPDLFESFNVGHDDRRGDPLLATTPWPAEAPSFAPAAQAYLASVAEVAARLDAVIGPLLAIDDLADRSRRGPDTMACIRYQHEDDESTADGRRRMGPHADYTSFTILRADPVPGLEILTADGWRPVMPEPDGVIVNVGDLLAMWTDDTWPSTLHRVPLRGGGHDPPVRRSVAYFHYPDLDEVVAPRPGWARPGSTYRPVTVRDHLAAKLVGPKRHERSAGASTLSGRLLD